jgi:hypothetical protein
MLTNYSAQGNLISLVDQGLARIFSLNADTPVVQRPDAACRRALAADLIDVSRVERILMQVL